MDSQLYPSRRQAGTGPDRTGRNIYLPDQAVIREVIRENPLVNTYVLSLCDELANHRFTAAAGQFLMISMPHLGEAPISFSALPANGCFSLTIRNSGSLTGAVHNLKPGDILGVRGPYGNGFPMERLAGGELVILAGGIGLAPLRPVIESLLGAGSSRLSLLYGCRTQEDFCFRDDFDRWQELGLDLHLTVDQADPDWQGRVGVVTELLDQVEPEPDGMALICGPGIMIRFGIQALQNKGLAPASIITTLERHMKCGVGICGHCHSGDRLICLDGPVFSADTLPEPNNP